ncbi:MAG: hypothetical protein GC162_03700 [Planctomycetes bacterium]|nr:hypothetical protein [Planctomycetota bacterium]
MPMRHVVVRRVVLVMLGLLAMAPIARAGDKLEYRVLSQRPDRLIVQLPDGLVVLAQQIKTAPVASVHCWVKTGSVYEGKYNGMGLSHFLEHLVSGGTTSHRKESENNAILGKIGAETNASTSLDNVRYYINTSSEHVSEAIDLISDWMNNCQIVPEEYARERDVILREFAMGRGEPQRIFWKVTSLAAYPNHPARHPTIGYVDEYMTVTRDQIYDFYKRMYVPNNMVFVVTGDIDPVAVVNQVATLWKPYPAKGLPGVVLPVLDPIAEPKEVTGYADVDRPRLRLVWQGVRQGNTDEYALDILTSVLGDGELSRLNKTVRDADGLVTSIDAYNYSEPWGKGLIGIDATCESDTIDKAKEAILAQISRLYVEGVTEEEVARAKRKVVAGATYESQTAFAAAERLASDFINTGDPDYLDHYVEQLQQVTIEQVTAAAKKYLDPQHMVTAKLLPQKNVQPELSRPKEAEPDPRLAKKGEVYLMDLDNQALVKEMMSESQSTAAAPATVITPVKMVRLPNGLRLIVQKNTRLPIVSMQWYQLGGLMADAPGHEGVANAMCDMLTQGAGDMSADDIARKIEDLGAQLNSECGNSTFYVSAQSLSKDWPTVLSIMSQIVTHPTFDEGEWAKIKPRLLAEAGSLNDTWYQQVRNSVRAAYFGPDNPWSQATVGRTGVIEKLSAGDLKAFYADHIAASDSVLAVFGDVDEAQVIAEATKLFADMPGKAKVPFKPLDTKQAESKIVQVTSTKDLVAVQIAYGPGMARQNPDYAALQVMNQVMSSFPVGWFDQALRGEGPGLVYAVGSGIMTGVAPGYWAVMFNTKVPTTHEAMSRALAVVDRIRNETIDAATLDRARTAVIAGEASDMQSNGQRASMAALNELYGLGYAAGDKTIAQLKAVTAADVHRVANTYLKTPLAVVLTPEPFKDGDLPSLNASPTPASAPAPKAAEPAAPPASSPKADK